MFNLGEQVWKQVKDSMWSGKVIGGFQKLDGTKHVVVETTHHQIFVSDAHSLRRVADISEFKRY